MGGPFGKDLNSPLIHYSGISVGFKAYSGRDGKGGIEVWNQAEESR